MGPQNNKRASYFATALRVAGERYDRYIANRDEWFDYAARKKKLERLMVSIEAVAFGLSELDILSRDDLASRVDPKEIDELVGTLGRLAARSADIPANLFFISTARQASDADGRPSQLRH
jgi:hypothetical protein